MISAASFALLRIIVLTLVVGSQVYLFVRVTKGILSLGMARRFKSLAILLTGAAIVALFVLNIYAFGRSRWADAPLGAQIFFFYLPAIWGFGSILSALLLAVLSISGASCRLVLWLARRRGGTRSTPTVDLHRRRLLQAAVAGAGLAPFVLSGYGAIITGKSCEVRELSLPFGRRLRVVQISDIHAGVYMSTREIRRYADRATALEPDVLVLTGDFVSNSAVYLAECVEEMAKVKTRYGTFATLGNHDNWFGRVRGYRAAFPKHGISLLVNSHRTIRTEEGPVAIAGIDDLRTGYPDLGAALHGIGRDVPTLLLSHRPEIFPQAASHAIPLTLSGHYHGGQIKLRLPGVEISPAQFMTPYPEGLYRIGECRMYVNRGIGTTFTPVRLNVPPEITVLNLT